MIFGKSMIKEKIFLFIFIILIQTSCKKDSIFKPKEPIPTSKQDSIYFTFVNRIGYKNDSIDKGSGNTRYLFAVEIETGYYNIQTNKSNILNIIYARNSLFLLTDSVVPIIHPYFINSQYNLKVSLFWNNKQGSVITRVRNLTYQLNVKGNDTVKTSGNKIIKFIWPDDSASGKFTKTYDGP